CSGGQGGCFTAGWRPLAPFPARDCRKTGLSTEPRTQTCDLESLSFVCALGSGICARALLSTVSRGKGEGGRVHVLVSRVPVAYTAWMTGRLPPGPGTLRAFRFIRAPFA